MNLPPEEAAAVQQSYRWRRNTVRGLFAIVLVVWLGFAGSMCYRGPIGDRGFAVWIALVAVVGICSLAVWHCPRCGAQFGRALTVDRCPECFVALEAEIK